MVGAISHQAIGKQIKSRQFPGKMTSSRFPLNPLPTSTGHLTTFTLTTKTARTFNSTLIYKQHWSRGPKSSEQSYGSTIYWLLLITNIHTLCTSQYNWLGMMGEGSEGGGCEH